MTHIHNAISLRREEDFEMTQVTLTLDRYMHTLKNGFIESVEPEKATVGDLERGIAEKGWTVTRMEQYIHDNSFTSVVRGSVLRQDGVEVFFYIEYDELFASMVRGAISAMEYTNTNQLPAGEK